jgi:amidase
MELPPGTDRFAVELLGALRTGELSSLEVVSAHLARIGDVNERCRAVVAVSATALDDARRADERRARGEPLGPLHGLPITVKDWIEVAGLPCAASIEARAGYVPRRDATVVARLRAAGAIVLGKTKPGETDEVHPRPLNPHDPTRTAGASSGGEAAIIAAHGSPLGIGSDSGGSIRWPAHCCGVAGLKPTSGLVPLTGHFPFITAMADPRTVIGPLARCVDDLELALRVIAGPDQLDASAVPVALQDSRQVDVSKLRVAVFAAFPGVAANGQVRRAFAAVVAAIRSRGGSVTESAPSRLPEARAITEHYWSRPESTSPKEWRPVHTSTLSGDQVEQHLFEWDRFRRDMTEFFRNVDVIVCPTAPRAAPQRTEIDDYGFTLPFSLSGNPVVTVPVQAPGNPGVPGDDDHMPIGVQIVARKFEDHVALAVARTIESISGPARPARSGG